MTHALLSPLRAHERNTSYTEVKFANDSLYLAVVFDITDLDQAFRLDRDGDRVVSRDELLPRIDECYDWLDEAVSLRGNYLNVALQREEAHFSNDSLGNLFVYFNYSAAQPQPDVLQIKVDVFDKFTPRFLNLGKLYAGDDLHQFILGIGNPVTEINIAQGGPGTFATFAAFTVLGIEHIFIGIDHILFLVALVLLGGRMLAIIKMVTAFTIAHSITLALAALQWVVVPAQVVESVIALSICYVAIENILLDGPVSRWLIAGAFGLIHGFGFANVLLEIGLPQSHLVTSLFAFNLGVEIGQICIVLVLMPMVWAVQKSRYRRRVVLAGSALIFVFGITWFLERAFELPVGLI